MEFILSKKNNKQVLNQDGYLYRNDKNYKNTFYWR